MEAKLIKLIQDKLTPETKTLRIENTCMFKITSSMGEAILKNPELTAISLTSCKIANLKGLEKLSKLETLDLSENNLNDQTASEYLVRCGSTLKRLFLAGNKIEKSETFSSLKDSKLRQLDLLGCPISSNKEYRKELFDLLKNLKIIDGVNRDGVEVSVFDSEEEAEEADATQDKEETTEMKEFIEKDEEKENQNNEKTDEVFKGEKRVNNSSEKNKQEDPVAKIKTA